MDVAARSEHLLALGLRIQTRRKVLNWTPADLALRSALTAQSIRSLERGSADPGTWTIHNIATALKISACWLAFGLGPMSSREGVS